MNFNDHSAVEGAHAFLSPSKYSWINYDDEKLDNSFLNAMSAARGTRLHALAAEMIEMGIKADPVAKTFNMYVNDCIGYRMVSEQMLFYSVNCFGTADAISFRKNLLRIFDLKNGVHPASLTQLEIYAALFCLEYGKKPTEIEMDLRIYQNDEVVSHIPDPVDIIRIMERIVSADRRIANLKKEAFR